MIKAWLEWNCVSLIDFIIKYFLFSFLSQSNEMLIWFKIKYGKILVL